MWLKWLQTQRIPSDKNGALVLEYEWWRPIVKVDGFFQTGPYADVMWRKALRFVPRKASIKRVLLLGYGAGGTNRLIRRRFPSARITAVEWDEKMVALAKELKLHTPQDLAELRIDDAAKVVQELTGTFDLIIFDLYRGNETSPLLEDPHFLMRLQTLLEPSGYFLVNAFEREDMLKKVADFFSWRRGWTYRWNHCGLFRPFGCGGQGDPLLPGFLPYHAVAGFSAREIGFQQGRQKVLNGEGFAGRGWNVGPLKFEMYYGDTEPIIERGIGRRLVYWQTLTKMDVPPGWYRSPFMPNSRKTGYAPVGTADDYWKSWSSHAQRHRKKWLTAPDARLESVDVETFIKAYRKGTLDYVMKSMFIWMLKRKAGAQKDLMQYWLAVTPTGKAIAGLAVLDIPEAKTSLHVIAFYTKEARHSPANYALIDHWFRHAISKGWTYLDFDIFRGPGDPRSWAGFSRFKSQFGTRFILYPNPLIRLVK